MFSGLLNQAANKALAQEDTSEVDVLGGRPCDSRRRRPTTSRRRVAELQSSASTTQGSVEGIKLYAATHAAKEGAPITGLIICRR